MYGLRECAWTLVDIMVPTISGMLGKLLNSEFYILNCEVKMIIVIELQGKKL